MSSPASASTFAAFPGSFRRYAKFSGYHAPTPIQDRCWPPAVDGRDVLGLAEPGSGKTLAFLLPMVERIRVRRRSRPDAPPTGPCGLVMVPTRELAKQVAATCRPFEALFGIPSTPVYGGMSRSEQVEQLDLCAGGIVVATPGRLNDHLGSSADLRARWAASLCVLVLDEADRMLAEGFYPDLCEIRQHLSLASCDLPSGTDGVGGTSSEGGEGGGAAGAVDAAGAVSAVGAVGAGAGAGAGPRAGVGAGAVVQTLMFSATFPEDLKFKLQGWLADPVQVSLLRSGARLSLKSTESGGGGGLEDGEDGVDGEDGGTVGGTGEAAHSAPNVLISQSVKQVVQLCAEHKKPRNLLKAFARIDRETKESGGGGGGGGGVGGGGGRRGSRGRDRSKQVLIFCNRIKTVKFLYGYLPKNRISCHELHSQMPQAERERCLRDFTKGKVQALIATDVAARGLHIEELPWVINYDFPSNLEQYAHRVGRTGRMGRPGTAISFFPRCMGTPLAVPLVDLLRRHKQELDHHLVRFAEGKDGAGSQKAGHKLRGGGNGDGGDGGGGSNDMDSDDDDGSMWAAKQHSSRCPKHGNFCGGRCGWDPNNPQQDSDSDSESSAAEEDGEESGSKGDAGNTDTLGNAGGEGGEGGEEEEQGREVEEVHELSQPPSGILAMAVEDETNSGGDDGDDGAGDGSDGEGEGGGGNVTSDPLQPVRQDKAGKKRRPEKMSLEDRNYLAGKQGVDTSCDLPGNEASDKSSKRHKWTKRGSRGKKKNAGGTTGGKGSKGGGKGGKGGGKGGKGGGKGGKGGKGSKGGKR